MAAPGGAEFQRLHRLIDELDNSRGDAEKQGKGLEELGELADKCVDRNNYWDFPLASVKSLGAAIKVAKERHPDDKDVEYYYCTALENWAKGFTPGRKAGGNRSEKDNGKEHRILLANESGAVNTLLNIISDPKDDDSPDAAFDALKCLARKTIPVKRQIGEGRRGMRLILTKWASAASVNESVSKLFVEVYPFVKKDDFKAIQEEVMRDKTPDEEERLIDFIDDTAKTSGRYGLTDLAQGTFFPCLDFCLDMVQLKTFLDANQLVLFSVYAGAMLLNGISMACIAGFRQWGLHIVILNLLTGSTGGQLVCAIKSFKKKRKSAKFTSYKIFEAVESYTSLFVSSYSVILAGHAPGFPRLSTHTTCVRFMSMTMSLGMLPLTPTDASKAAIFGGDTHKHLRKGLRPLVGYGMLYLFFYFETCGHLILPVFLFVFGKLGSTILLICKFISVEVMTFYYLREPMKGAGQSAGSLFEMLCGQYGLLIFVSVPFMVMSPVTGDTPYFSELAGAMSVVRVCYYALTWLLVAWAATPNETMCQALLEPKALIIEGLAGMGLLGYCVMGSYWKRKGLWMSCENFQSQTGYSRPLLPSSA